MGSSYISGGRIFGYTNKASRGHSLDELKRLGCNEVYIEKAGDQNINKRPELEKMMKQLKAGDEVFVLSLAEIFLGRNDLAKISWGCVHIAARGNNHPRHIRQNHHASL